MISARNLVWATAIAAGLLPSPGSVHAQDIYDELMRLQNTPPPTPVPDLPPEELCAKFIEDPLSYKCRSYYGSNHFVVEWHGKDTRMSHPIALEVLVREKTAVLCYDQCEVRDVSVCIPLEKALGTTARSPR